MSLPKTLTLAAAMRLTGVSAEAALPTASACEVSSINETMKEQRCPVGDVPDTVSTTSTYRGRVLRSELRSSSLAVCSELYKMLAVLHGANGSLMGARWDRGPVKLRWKYDGLVCSFVASTEATTLDQFIEALSAESGATP
jgi:hypothetical protein